VTYDDVIVGEFFVDILVENIVIVELKATRAFDDVHMAQCLNYLRATNLNVALLVNFGTPKIQVKRVIL
jgi:GxxExxY protein